MMRARLLLWRRTMLVLLGTALAAMLAGCAVEPMMTAGAGSPFQEPDVPFVMSPEPAVEAMLDLAGVRSGDVLYDLGCGEGRIVISAARRGARGVGIDIDPMPLHFARTYAKRAGVEERVRFFRGNFFEADLREATVVALYLSPEINRRLLPKLLEELAPGSRIVSNRFDMAGAWKPERTVESDGRTIYLWVVPPDRRIPAN